MKSLQPELLWSIFDIVTSTPRPSKKEGEILEYIKLFAIQHNLKYKQDNTGNIVIYSPASEGMEGHEPIILQSHVDMVCEKRAGVNFDFETQPIQTYIEDGWIKAKGTTLGADNGIGVAASLAVLIDESVKHPPLEVLFTIDEEQGLGGAVGLDTSMLTAKRLLNLDSGEEGSFFIGCAGGINTIATFEPEYTPLAPNYRQISITVGGLKGGHSGEDINKHRANALVILSRFLFSCKDNYEIKLCNIDGGNLPNAIARDAQCTIAILPEDVDLFEAQFLTFCKDVKREYCNSDSELTITYTFSDNLQDHYIGSGSNIIASIFTLPNGVMAFSQDVDGFVESSTNIASIKTIGSKIVICTSQRSSLESKKEYLSAMVKEITERYGASCQQVGGYPGWQPQSSSQLLNTLRQCYTKLFHSEPEVRAIHAGLECAIFLSKIDGLDMVSFGPTMEDIHSPDERLNIASTNRFYQLLCKVLESV